jgi:hypothetical protein
MSEPERKRTSKEPDTFREVDGFGKPPSKPGAVSRAIPALRGQFSRPMPEP